jgi:hypothetical protein
MSSVKARAVMIRVRCSSAACGHAVTLVLPRSAQELRQPFHLLYVLGARPQNEFVHSHIGLAPNRFLDCAG